ncbi:MAG TPA: ABC transporter permease [Gemmatimonadaceae bacterium]|jgi:putative ABC transport system permease protein|nr:ABC transporter permease [Gemmatimonadaceae bacterium]
MQVRDLARLRAELTAHVLFSVRTAIEAVGHNTLRAALTSLGILFGVASVIAMLAIGKGAEQEILEQMRLLGSNNVIITPLVEQKEEEAKDEGTKEPKKYSPGLTVRDARKIADLVPNVATVSGEVVLQTLVTREGRRRSGKVVGIDTTYLDLLNLRVAEGKGFAPLQVADGAPVAIIGHGVKTRFFTTEEPIGKPIKVGNVWLTVVGVLEDRKVSEATSQKLGIRDANMDVYVPLSTMLLRFRNRAQVTERDVQQASREVDFDPSNQNANEDPQQRAERTNYHQLDRIIVRVDQARYVTGVANVLQRMLTRRHNSVIDFEITVPELLLKQEQRTKNIFNVVLAAIAAISLIVGGIGIMNIMLASILERTREIGVRRAVGASQRDILAQFLSEAVLISLAGGVAGIIVGGGLSFGIERLADIQTIVSFFSVFIAFGVSITVGIVFGIVPAWRAARQDPVVCLRYE